MNTRIRPPRLLLWTCLALWLSLLVAGLWPFNFYPRNGIKWIQPKMGLRFERFGQAFSSAVWALNPGHRPFTIELWLRAAEANYPSVSPVFSIYGSSPDHDLNLAQSGSDLVVQGYFRSSDGKSEFHQLWMDKACRSSLPVFVTITSSEEGTSLTWIAEQRFVKRYAGFMPMDYVGRVLVGHGATKGSAWSGDVYGVAVYERAITTEEIAQHYAQWLAGSPALLGARALYPLNDDDHIVHNRGASAPDLVIPERYWPLTATILEIPEPFKRSDILDGVINILGFIPFGFFVMCYFQSAGHDLGDAFTRTTIVALLTTFAIELLQVFLPSRDSSLLDVINNVFGSIVGSLLAAKVRTLWVKDIG